MQYKNPIKPSVVDYQFGFSSAVESDRVALGLTEETIREISSRRNEPDWLLQWRLSAYRNWLTMTEPRWANAQLPAIDFQSMRYYAAPKKRPRLGSLDDLDPSIRDTFEKLGIPLTEQKHLANVAVDAVLDSVSIATTYQEELRTYGVIFCSFGEAVQKHPDLVKQYLGSVVPPNDNFYAALNAAVMSDGTFVYIPKGVKCPLDLSSYFRMNDAETGQFERTLIVADAQSEVSYLEGCTAPKRTTQQLHAAVVEIVANKDATVRYATVQNWYPGDEHGTGGVLNYVTKRGRCAGTRAKISWTQVETGAAITWKYPSVLLDADDSEGAFYSVAVTAGHQQADTGTKMIHRGKRTKSTIIAKSIAAGNSTSTYRGLAAIAPTAENAQSHAQCDSLIIGPRAHAATFPTLDVRTPTARVGHEATTTKLGADQLFYLASRGIRTDEAVGLLVNGYCREVTEHLPLEFAVEAKRLLALTLVGTVA
ncbi:MAG: Fe-S cluster assembly protein SufB [Patescibacteria group bacterium]